MGISGKQGIIIFGSSRSDGNTYDVSKKIAEITEFELVDLGSLNISAYDYQHKNSGDDFLGLAAQMSQAEVIILVSPVYWYTMSAQMKTFLDRWSDLVTIRKDLGRKLKAVQLLSISCSNDKDFGKGFSLPFTQTAEYMEMNFLGHFHFWKENGMNFNADVLNCFEALRQKIVSN